MKNYFLLLFFIFFINKAFADDRIVYLDVNLLLSKSEAGIYINNELKKINDAPSFLAFSKKNFKTVVFKIIVEVCFFIHKLGCA